MRWVHSLRLEYQRKRDLFLDALTKHTPSAYVSSTPAQAGMFQWLDVHVKSHSRYDGSNASVLLDELVRELVENNVLLMPAAVFSVPEPGVDNSEDLHFLRATVGWLAELR
jgi:aromatic amino acid aminotransferase I